MSDAMPAVECALHGTRGLGTMCVHAATAVDSGSLVGLYWADAVPDAARPDAWCGACEAQLLGQGWSSHWFEQADFKILCELCWDMGAERLAGQHTQCEGM